MPIAVLPKQASARVYIEGKGVVTLNSLMRQARYNALVWHSNRGKSPITQLFRTKHGSDLIGLQVMSVDRTTTGGQYIICGITDTDRPFTGSYDLKIGYGAIDIS